MSIVIVDARKWQNMFDLRSGEKVEADDGVIRMARRVLERHPYPGDVETAANRWVTDTALDLIGAYDPELVCLSYSQQYFAQRFNRYSVEQLERMIGDVFDEAMRFAGVSGYTPVIVGTGEMTELKEEIDLSRFDGLVSAGGGSRFAGLHNPGRKDLAFASSHPGVERIVSREEWTGLFAGAECDASRIPDYLLVCREGWTVRSAGTSLRRPARVQRCNFAVPVSTTLGNVQSITDVRGIIEENLGRSRIALIIIEGAGDRYFTQPFAKCANGIDWYRYETGEGQYLTLTRGTHQVFAYPPGHRFSEETMTQREFPFSGHFRNVPEHTLGADFKGRSIAVGNRSMFTHMVFGADISIECFARNLYNQGCIAVLKEDLSGKEAAT